jgi:hypothetical protein
VWSWTLWYLMFLPSLACYYEDLRLKSLQEHYRWTLHIPPSQTLEGNTEYYTEKLSWATLLVTKKIPLITLSLHLKLIWGLVCCISLIPLKLLLKSESNPFPILRSLLQLPFCGRCSSTKPLLVRVLVPKWFLCHLVRKPYPCHRS